MQNEIRDTGLEGNAAVFQCLILLVAVGAMLLTINGDDPGDDSGNDDKARTHSSSKILEVAAATAATGTITSATKKTWPPIPKNYLLFRIAKTI